tara:strand:- start:442 stop:696 length:255 start_codon:yes stop_codon:yes gene_type:complete
MSNHVFNSMSSEDMYYLYSEKTNNAQIGGKDTYQNIATEPCGGFPPIFIIEQESKLTEKTKNRELAVLNTSISIKTLLEKQKNR